MRTQASFVNSLGLKMICIPAGRFRMRTPPPLLEVPQQSRSFERLFAAREAEVDRDFYLAEFAVTNGMYRRFVDATSHAPPRGHMLDVDRVYQGEVSTWGDDRFNGDDHPVVGRFIRTRPRFANG